MNSPQDQQGSPDPQNWQPPATPASATAPPATAAAHMGPGVGPGAPPHREEHPPISAYDPRYKSPLVASFLSLFPGVGQIYVGYYRVGFTHALIIASIITLLASGMDDTFRPLLALFMAFFWLYNIIDAGRRAALYNHAVQGGADVNIPDNLPVTLSASGGSMAAGVVLLVVGALLLMNTAFDFSMRWVEDWWPLAPILFGGYLLSRGMKERSSRS
jgi:TM2 domain-containing membrane protein YozV